VCHEDGRGDEDHTTDGDDTEQVTVIVRDLIVFAAELQVVVSEQRHADHAEELQQQWQSIPIPSASFSSASEQAVCASLTPHYIARYEYFQHRWRKVQ